MKPSLTVRRIAADQGAVLQELRGASLRDAPDAFSDPPGGLLLDGAAAFDTAAARYAASHDATAFILYTEGYPAGLIHAGFERTKQAKARTEIRAEAHAEAQPKMQTEAHAKAHAEKGTEAEAEAEAKTDAAVQRGQTARSVPHTQGASPALSRYAFVSALWVAPAVRHLRGGELLVDTASAWLTRERATRIYAWVPDTNLSAMRFYERLGFTATGERARNPQGLDQWEILLARAASAISSIVSISSVSSTLSG